MEGAKGTKNAGKAASDCCDHEGSKSLDAKPSGASPAMPGGLSNRIFDDVETDDEETIYETQYDFTADVDALVSGEDLSEEFREKAVTIFEAAVTEKVNAELSALQEAFEVTLVEQVEAIKTELALSLIHI